MRERPVGIGIIGAGFLAATRARCYGKIPHEARLVAVTSRRRDVADEYARTWNVAAVAEDLDALLARDDVDMVDLCVPNNLHRPFAERAAAAGKHVVCTKPLTAYVGQDLGDDPDAAAVSATPPERMREIAVADAQAMVEACRAADVRLMYGENWVHAPSIVRAAGLLERSGGTILEMHGHESHNGSHSPYSKSWKYTGGGALLRLGAHPIGTMIHLKALEGRARGGDAIRPVAVTAEVADLTRAVPPGGACRVATGWQDVENWGQCVIAFSDGSRGVAHGSDNLLGGMQSRMVILASDCHLECNLSPHDLVRAYAPDADVFGDAYIMEKVDSGAGWSTPLPDEDWASGQAAMVSDFARAVREGREARSDGELGLEVTRVIYGAYVSAHEGRRVTL